ncbi:hypothetical protein FH972_023434 [Carpinus fangiana]|uniref:UBC core domain-containing protein n=1 Tax=Carpinus fangiana TaxID=176857 RepID=A0A5N6KVF1_9ROSI|nr:hypothetical protein FH972_023434 [Carpinus fangiana]
MSTNLFMLTCPVLCSRYLSIPRQHRYRRRKSASATIPCMSAVDTHQTDVASLYPNGLTCHASIPQRAFRAFLRSGIPPRHTALVSRIQSAESPSSGLVPESELKILDRDILIGDIVKRDPRHTMSGTVIGMEIEVYLSTAARWTGDRLPPVLDSTELVGPISARDIAWPPHVEVSDIVIYHSWVGRVADCWQDVTIRLANGSVVVPENEDDIIPLHSDLACEVGDSVTTKKSNLRRGRWIFGSYDPNIEPQGVVLKVETTSIAVDWLGSDVDPSGSGLVGVPNSEIGQDILQSGDLHLYDPQLLSCENQPQQHIINLGIDGAVQVRLGATTPVRDISVPFECTHVIHTTGWDQDGQDHMNEDADSGPLEHAMAAILGPRLGNMSTRWMDENDEPIDDTEDWEDEDVHMENGQPINEEITHYSNDRELPQANETKSLIEGESDVEPQNEDSSLLDHVSLVGSTFSYANMLSKIDTNERPEPMMILEGTPPVDHHFSQSISEQNPTAKLLRRVQHEVQMLQSGLPEGVFVRSWEQAINLFRVMFIGPVDTPYEYVPIVIDLYLHDLWPNEPPKTFFHSWTDGTAPINPNLYEDGKICLSLLGTWPGEEQNQGWTPKSTLLQLVVSILGLVLVKEPYFNEAGFEVRAGSVEARIPSALYSERTYFRSRSFIKHAMGRPIHGFEEVIDLLYRPSDQGPNLLIRAIWSAVAVLHRSQGASSINLQKAIGRIVSRGALMPLRREIKALIELMADNLQSCLTQFLEDGHIPQGGPGGTFDELASFTESKFSHTATQA